MTIDQTTPPRPAGADHLTEAEPATLAEPIALMKSAQGLLSVTEQCFNGDDHELHTDADAVIEVLDAAWGKIRAVVIWSWNNHNIIDTDDLCKAIAILRVLTLALREPDAMEDLEDLNVPWVYALQGAGDIISHELAYLEGLEAGRAS